MDTEEAYAELRRLDVDRVCVNNLLRRDDLDDDTISAIAEYRDEILDQIKRLSDEVAIVRHRAAAGRTGIGAEHRDAVP